MAKKSKMVSPVKAAAVAPEAANGEDEEGDSFFDAAESLGNLQPNSPHATKDNAQHQASVAKMGNANSKDSPEEINANLRAYSHAIRNGQALSTAASEKNVAKGKLKQPTKSPRNSNNPQYKNPMLSVAGQRELAPKQAKRGSAYDLPGDSPVKEQVEVAKLPFSPLKKQKKGRKKGGVAAGDGHEDEVTAQVDGGVDEPVDPRYVDRFPADVVRKHQQAEEAEAAAGAAVEDHEIIPVVAKKKGQCASQRAFPALEQEPAESTASKRGRGRPRGSRKTAAPVESTPATPTTPKTQSKAGRPKKPSVPETTADDATSQPDESARPRRSPRKPVPTEKATSSSSAKPTAVPKPKSKANKRESARANLARRMPQHDGDNEPEPEDEAPDDQGSNSLYVNDNAEARERVPEVERVRPSELNFTEVSDESEHEDDLPADPVPKGSRKRNPATQPDKPNKSRKKTRFARATQPERSEPTEEERERNRRRLFGHWPAFAEVLKKLDAIGRNVEGGATKDRNEIRLTDDDVQATFNLCIRAIRLYGTLRTQEGPMQPEQDPVNLLTDINERVEGLCGKNDDYPTDFHNNTRATQIYFHLIPKLIRLVKVSIICYESLDEGTATENQISMGHIKIVSLQIHFILDLINSMKNYAKPPTDLHVVQPVREIAPVLRDIHSALAKRVDVYDKGLQRARREEQERLDRIAEEKEEQIRKQQEAVANQWRKKWQRMHTERLIAEGGLPRPEKRDHLTIRDHNYYTQRDQNGAVFEREEVFRPRIGPLPEFIDAANEVEWTLQELCALHDGLRDYAGDNVFERIFRRYCCRGQLLNRFNVTEIVVTAVRVREQMIASRRKAGLEIERWIEDIPTVWTRAHRGVGQENGGEGEDADADGEVDVTMSGALPADSEVDAGVGGGC